MSDVGGAAAAAGTSLPVAGWYADPLTAGGFRWWSGFEWTDYAREPDAVAVPAVEPAPEPARDPFPPAAPWAAIDADTSSGYVPMAGRGPANSLGIWLLTILPLMSFALLVLAMALSPMFPALVTEVRGRLYSVPAFVVAMGLGVFFAHLDRRALMRYRITPPSIWWVILPLHIVYVARQRIALKRHGIRSTSPSNVFVLALVLVAFMNGAAIGPRVDGLARAEVEITQALEQGSSASWSVDCPNDAPMSAPGAQVDCAATSSEGRRMIVTLARMDDRTLSVVRTTEVTTP